MMGVGRIALLIGLLMVTPLWGKTVEGKFGKALVVAGGAAHGEVSPVYAVVPITVECFARVPGKTAEVVLLSNEPRGSGTHWELFVEKGTGKLGTLLPTYKTARIVSGADVADGEWHYLALV